MSTPSNLALVLKDGREGEKVIVVRKSQVFLGCVGLGVGLVVGRTLIHLLLKKFFKQQWKDKCGKRSKCRRYENSTTSSSSSSSLSESLDVAPPSSVVFSAESPSVQLSGAHHPATLAARFYPMHPSSLTALSPLIVPATTFLLRSAEHGASLTGRTLGPQNIDKEGFIYSRWASPTIHLAATMISKLEGCTEREGGTLLFSSGMAAITCTFLTYLSSGDHMICPLAVYGGVAEFLHTIAPRLGIIVTYVDATSIHNYTSAIRPNTKLIYAESPCNPTMRLTDLYSLGEICAKHNIPLVVDGTFATPYHTRALGILGVHVSIHAATKYLGGHSDLLCGAVTSNEGDFLTRCASVQKLLGSTLSAFDAYLLARGLKTLDVRMARHASNALSIAEFLSVHPCIEAVYYPGLKNHPDHELANKIMRNGYGGMLSFEVKGGISAGIALVENLKLINLAVSLGSTESLICHSASTTHKMVEKETRLKAGISDGLVRFSVGLEDVRDLIADLDQALSKIQQSA